MNMTRIEFIGQTHQGSLSPIDDIINFFDHTMAAYELLNNITDYTVHGEINNYNSSLGLKINSHNESDLVDAYTYIINTIHNHKDIYGKSFIVDAQMNNSAELDLIVRETNISNQTY